MPVHSVRVREGVHHRPREPSAHPDHGPERLAHVPVVVDAPLTAGHPTPFLPLIINLAYLRDEVRALVVARGIVLADAGDGVRGGAEVEDLLPIAREDDVLLDVPREVKRESASHRANMNGVPPLPVSQSQSRRAGSFGATWD